MSLLFTCQILCDRCGQTLEHRAQATKVREVLSLPQGLKLLAPGWGFSGSRAGRIEQHVCPGCAKAKTATVYSVDMAEPDLVIEGK